MRRADRHVHTHASSDASFSPEEVFSIGKARGLSAVTFSDHDTTDSIAEGQRLAPLYEVDFLPGIEITSSWREIPAHVLCYFKDGPPPSLQEFLADKIWSVGKQFNLAMLDYLQGQGKDVTVAEYDAEVEAQEESDSTALYHLLVKKGIVKHDDIPVKILGSGKIDKSVEVTAHMFSKSAVEKLEKAGGKAIYQC